MPKYDLDAWNPEFFERLHGFLSLASDLGVIVEVVTLSNTYNNDIWALNPLNPSNNVNDTESIAFPEYLTMRHPRLFARQCALVHKIVEETNQYDNIIYEVCNEPTGHTPGVENAPDLEEVNAWQTALAQIVRDTDPHQHLIAGEEAYRHDGYRQGADMSFRQMFFDVVNIHPLPNTSYNGTDYDMGTFMSKQLKLRAVGAFCLAAQAEAKPLNYDEDNVASRFIDVDGWTIHRKRAWVTLLSGGHYDYIDFSILPGRETGTTGAQRHIRTWFKHLSEFVHSMDLARARTMPGWLREQPTHTVEAVFGVAGEDYAVYLADERELTEPGAGEPIQGALSFTLPDAKYQVACYAPATGLYSPWLDLEGGPVRFATPAFPHDLVVRIKKCTNG